MSLKGSSSLHRCRLADILGSVPEIFPKKLSDSDWAWISSNKACSQHTPRRGFSESDRKHNMGCCCLFKMYFDFKSTSTFLALFNRSNSLFFHIIMMFCTSSSRRLRFHQIVKRRERFKSNINRPKVLIQGTSLCITAQHSNSSRYLF